MSIVLVSGNFYTVKQAKARIESRDESLPTIKTGHEDTHFFNEELSGLTESGISLSCNTSIRQGKDI